jgi:hypothetical protein
MTPTVSLRVDLCLGGDFELRPGNEIIQRQCA